MCKGRKSAGGGGSSGPGLVWPDNLESVGGLEFRALHTHSCSHTRLRSSFSADTRMGGTRDRSTYLLNHSITAAAFTHPSNGCGRRRLTSLPHRQKPRAELYRTITEAWRQSDCLAVLFYLHSFCPSVFLSVSVVSSPSLLLCLFSLMPMVAKVTGINSYSYRFAAVLITIYLCKPQCA